MQALFPAVAGGVPNPGTEILTKPQALRKALDAPFHPDDIEWRPGGGGRGDTAIPMAYITARAARERLNDVCGIGGWQSVVYSVGGQLACSIAIWMGGQWITKTDGAHAGFLEPVVEDGKGGKVSGKEEQRIEMESKGAFSNAFKRAAAAWGIGEYLYKVKPPWMPVQKNAGGYVTGFTDESKKKLYDVADGIWCRHLLARAADEEQKARKLAENADALDRAHESAVRAYRIRVDVLGEDHEDTKRIRALGEQIGQRLHGKKPGDTAPVTPAAPAAAQAAPPAQPSQPAANTATATATDPPSIKVLTERIATAGSPEEIMAAAKPWWQVWAADSDEGLALRHATEAGMQRFIPGWTIAAAAAQKAAAAQPNGAAPAKGGNAAKGKARAPARTAAK